jgi:hypothetical protein
MINPANPKPIRLSVAGPGTTAFLPLNEKSSSTVILNVHCELLPPASVAVQVTVVVPTGYKSPDGGLQVTIGFGSHASTTVARRYVTIAPNILVQVVMMSS